MRKTNHARNSTPRKNGTETPRITTQGKAVPLENRQKILKDAKKLILEGVSMKEIADRFGIAERTLEYWFAGLGDEYLELRRTWIDNLLGEAGELLKDVSENGDAHLRLARARELWKRATWYAERRDRARYGDEKPVSVNQGPTFNVTILTAPSNAPRVLEQEPQANAVLSLPKELTKE